MTCRFSKLCCSDVSSAWFVILPSAMVRCAESWHAALCCVLCAVPSLLQVSLEMETFHLLDLARCSDGSSIQAAAFCIAAAERYSNR
jgi:hypothetical protein